LLLEAGREATGPSLAGSCWNGTYDKPFILDHGALRFLHFDLDKVQSLMRCDDRRLCLRYTRNDGLSAVKSKAARILILGLGGGSLANSLPAPAICNDYGFEVDPNVMALREEFRCRGDERFAFCRGTPPGM